MHLLQRSNAGTPPPFGRCVLQQAMHKVASQHVAHARLTEGVRGLAVHHRVKLYPPLMVWLVRGTGMHCGAHRLSRQHSSVKAAFYCPGSILMWYMCLSKFGMCGGRVCVSLGAGVDQGSVAAALRVPQRSPCEGDVPIFPFHSNGR
jgi:hypothetical protein